MQPPRVYTVLLVDDHPIVRLGLRYAFEREPDFAVCGEAADVGGALDMLARAPDLVVTDLSLEGRSGLELVGQMQRYYPGVPALVVSMHDSRLYAQRALAAGARGYVMKGGEQHEVLHAAREVLRGEVYVGGSAGPEPLPEGNGEADDRHAALTNREVEVLMLLGEGYAPRHIAEALCLSVSTVEAYRERLKAKLGIADSALLVRYAVRWLRDHERAVASGAPEGAEGALPDVP